MNERIQQLDKQAKLWAMDNTNFPISSHIPAGYTEKFAKLIVTEVTNIVLHYTNVDEGVAVAKKHFGIEE